METLTYSIIIPAYNESERLPASLDKILAYISEQGWNAEVIVVNDGSRDSTAEVARQYARSHPIVRLAENPGNRGKGYAVRNGMSQAKADILLFSDADLSSPIYEASKLLRGLAQGADIAIGSRWLDADLQTQRQPFYRQLSGRVFNLLLRVVLGLKQKDTQCGFKAFTRRSAQAIFPLQRIERWGFDPEILYIANKFGFKTAEVPVEWANDERSKISPLKDGTRMFLELCKIRWNAIRGLYAVPKNPPPPSRVAGSQLPVAGSEAGGRKQ